MHAKNNRQNHDFQIAFYLVGSCHTADGAYALLCDLREDRAHALAMVESSDLRRQARRLVALEKLQDAQEENDRVAQLEAAAELSEINAGEALEDVNRRAAERELAFIQKCIDIVEPYRRYSHLPDPLAHEACQMEEWRLELIERAKNYLLTGSGIPPDQLHTMRMHPQFETGVWPQVEGIMNLLATGQREQVLKRQPTLKRLFAGYLEAPMERADALRLEPA